MDAVALPEALQLLLDLLVLVHLLLVGALHKLYLLGQLHQLELDGLFAFLLVVILHQQLLLLVLHHSQLFLQLVDDLLFLVNQSHEFIVAFLEVLALLEQRAAILCKFTLFIVYPLYFFVGKVKQVFQLFLILGQPLIQLSIFFDSLKDVPANVLILIDLLSYEVQLTRQLSIFLSQLYLKLFIIPQGFHQFLDILLE